MLSLGSASAGAALPRAWELIDGPGVSQGGQQLATRPYVALNAVNDDDVLVRSRNKKGITAAVSPKTQRNSASEPAAPITSFIESPPH
jgi:hypothetical protein